MIIPFFSLRFFNALLIFCHHKNIVDNPYLIAFGPCAVSFFLMLSGFVMCHGYEGKILSSDFNYKNFLFHRFASKHLTGFFIQIFSILVSCYMIYIYPLVPEYLHFQALFFIPSALVILAFSLFKNTMLSSLLEKNFFKYLGEISFTFYMLHILGIAFVNIVISRLGVDLNFLYKSILDLVFVLIGSVLVCAFFEKPVAKKLVMVFDRKYDS